ncbi:MAG: carbonic anhydrase [Halohasta sp.]
MNETVVDLLARNADHSREFEARFDEVQDAQHPAAVTVCCSDSRVLQDHAWGNDEPGQLFTCSNIGNRVVQRTPAGDVVSGDVLYPIAHTGTETAIVMGHTGCGAVTATYDDLTTGLDEPAGITHCLDLLKTRLAPAVDLLPDDIGRAGAINRLVEYNVDRQIQFLRESSDIPDDVDCIGVVYDFQDVYGDDRGEIHVINVNGNTDVETLRSEHSEVGSRVDRLWEYE